MDFANGDENVVILIHQEALSMLPDKFQYTPHNIQGPGCHEDPNLISYEGCECKASSCVAGACTCNLQNYESSKLRSIMEEEFMALPVYECNSMCKCGTSCRNRLVQHGVAVKLEVIKTQDKGLGLKTLENIAKGRFVCEYAGEIIGTGEAIKRTKQLSTGDMNYIIAVHEFYPDGYDGPKKKFSTRIDPKTIGNVGRFINHSCDPNLIMIPVRVDSLTPHLALFAIRDIKMNEDLSFSYAGLTTFDDRASSLGNTPQDSCEMEKKICKCGSSNCSGFLPFDKSSFES